MPETRDIAATLTTIQRRHNRTPHLLRLGAYFSETVLLEIDVRSSICISRKAA